jgi:hypothetical protein
MRRALIFPILLACLVCIAGSMLMVAACTDGGRMATLTERAEKAAPSLGECWDWWEPAGPGIEE